MKNIKRALMVFTLALVVISIVAPQTLFLASSLAEKWTEVGSNVDFDRVNDLETALDVYSTSAESDESLTEYSPLWTDYIGEDGWIILENQGLNVIGQSVRFKDVAFGGAYSPLTPLDIVLTIDDAVIANNKQGTDEWIAVSKAIGGLQTSGYTQVNINVQFYQAGTDIEAVVDPLIKFSDIDYDQVVGAASSDSFAVSTDSKLVYNTDGENTYFSYADASVSTDKDRWVIINSDETSSFNFVWGMNKLDVDGPSSRVGGFTDIDIRLRGTAGRLELNKVDELGNPLEGAMFTVYNESGTEVTQVTTNSNGYARTPLINLGDYTVVETSAPEGYVLDNTVYPATINSNNQIVTINSGNPIINEGYKGQIELTKTNEADEPLQGVEFTIYDSEMNSVEVITTDENGYAISSELAVGDYIVIETEQLDGYIPNAIEYLATIANDGDLVTLNDGEAIINQKLWGQVEINKVDENNQPLADAEFTIYDSEMNSVEVIITDENGYAISSNLEYGDYTIIETKAPDGYQLELTKYPFTIENDGEIVTINNGDPVVNYREENLIITTDSEDSEEKSETNDILSENSSEETVDLPEVSTDTVSEDEELKLTETGNNLMLVLIVLASVLFIVLGSLKILIKTKLV